MMPVRTIFSIVLLLSQYSAYAEGWFEGSSPLINAHQNLLTGNLEESFSSIIQVWQEADEPYVKTHLNELLLKGLEKDCGKSFSNVPLPEWLEEVIVRRQTIQSPGRINDRLVIDALSKAKIKDITFIRWPDMHMSGDSETMFVEEEEKKIRRNVFSLAKRLPIGLYKLMITNQDGQVYESWIVIGEAEAKEVVRWETKDSWKVDKFGLLNPYCELPVMDIGLYDYVDNQYVRLWHRAYETKYPSTLPPGDYKPERYVLAVSITHSRWQGPITIEEQQVISKTYDISEE